MTTICGHERSELLCVLHWSIRDDERKRTKERCKCGGACCTIYNNLIDPAKLAEMLAERGQELGLDVATYSRRAEWLSTKPTEWATFQTWHYTCDNNTERGVSLHSRNENGYDWTMPQARAILLAWLQLPDGAHDEAEKVLRGDK